MGHYPVFLFIADMNSKGKDAKGKQRRGKSYKLKREDTDSPVPRPSGAMAVETAHPSHSGGT